MYRKVCIGVIFAALFWGLFACNEPRPEVTENKRELTMAEDSELALLMRQLTEETDSIRAAIVAGEEHPLWSRIRDLHTATPTDSTSAGPVFEGFTAAFIGSVKDMQRSDTAQSKYFNAVIDRCMDCHAEFCPGPMKRIRKFYVRNEVSRP